MTVLEKVKSFFKRPKSKDKAGQLQSASGSTEQKAAEDPQKKAGEAGGQQSSGVT